MGVTRGFFLIAGLLSLLLGMIGIVLPILPTVPFILLSAYCFARSSQRLHHWLMTHPWFSDALMNWQENKAIRKGLKKKAYIVSMLSFSVSIFFTPIFWVKILLFFTAICLFCYLKSVPEIEDGS